MKVRKADIKIKSQKLKYRSPEESSLNEIDISRGGYYHGNDYHLLKKGKEKYFEKLYRLNGKTIYRVHFPITGRRNNFSGAFEIVLNWRENLKFLCLQGELWISKEQNIRYLVNIFFLLMGVIIALLNLLN